MRAITKLFVLHSNAIKHRVCEEDYGWNHSICACKCDKGFEIGEYLKDFTCTKSSHLIVTCDSF